MSTKKEKLLESAQKFILKGLLDRAIKDYEQVVALDPSDIRHRQRLAELLVRVNRKEEAIGEYEAIGKYYADNTYYLKAIAVFKQIQKLDPDNIKLSLSLASLNEKQGLTGNALAEYSRVYSHYERGGKRSEALSILEKMIAIDPENLNTRLKFAETNLAAGYADKAFEDFVQVARQLRERGDESAFGQVCDRVRYLFPGKKEFLLELAASRLKSGDAASVVAELRELTNNDQGNLRAWQLLAEALRATGETGGLKALFQKMASIFPEELSSREGLIQCALDRGDTEEAVLFLKLHGPLFLEKRAFEALERPYLVLLSLLPEDTRVLNGLKHLYEASREQAKLAEIVGKLDSLNRAEAEEEIQAEGIPLEEFSPVSAGGQAKPLPEPAGEEEVGIHLPGEEFDLALFEAEEPVFAGKPESREAGDAGDAEDAEDAGDAALPAEPCGPVEEALELELSEDDLVDLEDICARTATDEADDLFCPDLPAGETEAVAAGHSVDAFPDGADDLLFGEGFSFEEEGFIEPEAEVVAKPEAGEAAPSAGHDKYSQDGLFSAFKKELDQQLDKEDTETHYNLGIAFKEMGLYDDAIAEFRFAAIDPRRKVDCILLQGICCREKGDFSGAEDIFREGIALPGASAEELSPLRYELALLYDATGRKEEALQLYCDINATNPGFRDTAEKIAGLLGVDEQEFDELELVEPDGEIE